MKRIDAAIAIVFRGPLVLICQRKNDGHLGGYWEFPGGKCEVGETLEQCLERELEEELAIRARPMQRLSTVEHDYPTTLVRLHPFICAFESGEIEHRECQAHQWIDPRQLREYQFPPANDALFAEVIAWFETHLAAGSASPDLSAGAAESTIDSSGD